MDSSTLPSLPQQQAGDKPWDLCPPSLHLLFFLLIVAFPLTTLNIAWILMVICASKIPPFHIQSSSTWCHRWWSNHVCFLSVFIKSRNSGDSKGLQRPSHCEPSTMGRDTSHHSRLESCLWNSKETVFIFGSQCPSKAPDLRDIPNSSWVSRDINTKTHSCDQDDWNKGCRKCHIQTPQGDMRKVRPTPTVMANLGQRRGVRWRLLQGILELEWGTPTRGEQTGVEYNGFTVDRSRYLKGTEVQTGRLTAKPFGDY